VTDFNSLIRISPNRIVRPLPQNVNKTHLTSVGFYDLVLQIRTIQLHIGNKKFLIDPFPRIWNNPRVTQGFRPLFSERYLLKIQALSADCFT
jgi:hypothetical protein